MEFSRIAHLETLWLSASPKRLTLGLSRNTIYVQSGVKTVAENLRRRTQYEEMDRERRPRPGESGLGRMRRNLALKAIGDGIVPTGGVIQPAQ